MTPISLGIFASASNVAVATSYESIATSNPTSVSFTFSSIPQTYSHLQIRAIALQNLGNDWRGVTMRFNGDSGSNYTAHSVSGNGSTLGGGGSTGQTGVYPVVAGWSSLQYPGVSVIDILDYSSTNKNKTVRFLHGIERNGTPAFVEFGSSAWLNTSAISSISFTVNADNFTSGTTFALYGIKVAA